MNNELTKKEFIEEIKVWISEASKGGYMEAIVYLQDVLNLAYRLSDKPQVNEEDFEELVLEMSRDISYDMVFFVKENLKKYLKPQPPRTQGDKISQMSNEEKAEMFFKMQESGAACVCCINLHNDECCASENCKQGILEFLNSGIEADKKG